MKYLKGLLNIYYYLSFNYNLKLKSNCWGLGIGPNPQSPIPNPQSPIPMLIQNKIKNLLINE